MLYSISYLIKGSTFSHLKKFRTHFKAYRCIQTVLWTTYLLQLWSHCGNGMSWEVPEGFSDMSSKNWWWSCSPIQTGHLEKRVCLLSVGQDPLKAVLILSNLLLQLCTDLAPPDLHTNIQMTTNEVRPVYTKICNMIEVTGLNAMEKKKVPLLRIKP